MALLTFDLLVEYDAGDPVRVTADQRDMARFEREENTAASDALENPSFVFMRSIAYHALKRRGLLPMKPQGGREVPISREEWEDRALEVRGTDDGVESPDPGQPAAPEGASSGSH